MNRNLKHSFGVVILCAALFTQGCFNVGRDVRIALALSPVVLDALVQSGAINVGVSNQLASDFTELGNDSLTLETAIKACKDKPCKLAAVEAFAERVESVFARGRTNNPKIEKIFAIMRDIVTAAKIYYGASQSAPTIAKARTRGATLMSLATGTIDSLDDILDAMSRNEISIHAIVRMVKVLTVTQQVTEEEVREKLTGVIYYDVPVLEMIENASLQTEDMQVS
jgi:hypothetical protein